MNTNTKPHLKPYRWEKGKPSANPNGRPKLLKSVLSDSCGLSPSQTNTAILNLLTYTKTEIEQICNDSEQPMFNRIISKALIKSYNNGSLYALESLLNRTHGMPKQQTELTTIQEQPIFVSLDLDVK